MVQSTPIYYIKWALLILNLAPPVRQKQQTLSMNWEAKVQYYYYYYSMHVHQVCMYVYVVCTSVADSAMKSTGMLHISTAEYAAHHYRIFGTETIEK